MHWFRCYIYARIGVYDPTPNWDLYLIWYSGSFILFSHFSAIILLSLFPLGSPFKILCERFPWCDIPVPLFQIYHSSAIIHSSDSSSLFTFIIYIREVSCLGYTRMYRVPSCFHGRWFLVFRCFETYLPRLKTASYIL